MFPLLPLAKYGFLAQRFATFCPEEIIIWISYKYYSSEMIR